MPSSASALRARLARLQQACGDEDPAEWLRRRYQDDNLTIDELSSAIGFKGRGFYAVTDLLHRYGIPRRDGHAYRRLAWRNQDRHALQRAYSAELGSLNRVHGEAATRTTEYVAWMSMRQRCNDKGFHAYEFYGGRGIRVCERWQTFTNFLADMGRKPSPDLTLERVNNDGGYDPSNCKWATRTEQNRNKRRRATR